MYNLIKELLIKILKTISKLVILLKINAETYDGKGLRELFLQIGSLVIILDNIFRINKLKEVGKEDMVQRQKKSSVRWFFALAFLS